MKESKYQIIVSYLKSEIESGTFKRGNKIPSIRALSQQFQCSKDTVQRALMELKHLHMIYAIPNSGYYVLEGDEEADELHLELIDTPNQAYEDFRLCVNETLVGREHYLFNYYPQQEGLLELRKAIQQLLLDSAIYCKLEDLVLTAGTQQALYILSQINFPNQQSQILVEQPTYHRMNSLIKSQQLPYRTIERTTKGIDLKQLEDIFKTGHVKFFYTIPRFHYPLGHSYNRQEKEAILHLAKTYQVYIVEDDYLADFDNKRELPFHYLDEHEQVIYIKSFSTSLFPALRITALLLPPAIRDAFIVYKSAVDYDSNLIMQKSLALYINNLMFEKNRLSLLHQQEKEQLLAEQLLKQTPPPCPAVMSRDGLILEIRTANSISALKHSQLPLDFFEDAYLHTCPYRYAKISYQDLPEALTQLQNYF
ncbi:aminotransferase-like domain-containing protein [Streptococcus himalayensis]|uniref:GntR family transcriptional regulator n=1 Tax=Streptococcus himalayensis TaxID=1888195 RepID=A0A917EFJ9_9STRE|nr:PLP-dependent aminotransferase family protein [Streptococcus himalayensis]GGE36631.1 GntR family transcriptional regulator [Streptococcus himalayensis]